MLKQSSRFLAILPTVIYVTAMSCAPSRLMSSPPFVIWFAL
ncbi:MAG: hypothetical protein ACK55Z_21145 [bacterium]